MEEAYKGRVSGIFTIFQRHKEFLEGSESPALIPYGGRPATTSTETNVNSIAAVIQEDCHKFVQILAESLHISKTSACVDTHWKPWNEWNLLNVGITLPERSTNGHTSWDLSSMNALIENDPDFFKQV